MKVNLIILEAALELVPKEILSHPAVVKNAKKRSKKPEEILLDISLHYHAMKKLKDWHKRGRPDIIHQIILTFLSEKSDIKGEFYIHTINSKIIKVNPNMRPPKTYNRFVGLMEQLLLHGKVPPNSSNPLMEVLNLDLHDIKKKYKIVLLWEKGKKISPTELCNLENSLLGIGGFAHGDFSEEILELADEKVSISSMSLESFQVVCRILSSCNYLLGWP
jgi:rRNA small subunit pseudouridine methyltransferase Nep1